MRIEVIRCDNTMCKRETSIAQPSYGNGWFTVSGGYYTDSMHFCSKHCLVTWATADDLDAEIASKWGTDDTQ